MATKQTQSLINEAVFGHQSQAKPSFLDRVFARMFSGLVYTQIWEDPYIDLEAMAIEPHHRIVTISSAGCNALNYLLANPAAVNVVDLNGAHLSLLELKIAALKGMDRYSDFERFFAQATDKANIEIYDRVLRWQLSTTARVYWNSVVNKKRRIEMFKNGFYRYGLLGQFIRFMKLYARLHGVNLNDWTECKNHAEQIRWFDDNAPKLFNGPLIQILCRSPIVLYHLGIPPRQYNELCDGHPKQMAQILKERARALLTTGTVDENYFAWQATSGAYRLGGPYPPYLKADNFEKLTQRHDRITLHQTGFRQFLQTIPDQSVDRFVLLDAQDWMDDSEIARLWAEMSRTARAGARIIFRTAGEKWRAGDRLPATLKRGWATDETRNKALTKRDMSGIYGRFHLYERQAL